MKTKVKQSPQPLPLLHSPHLPSRPFTSPLLTLLFTSPPLTSPQLTSAHLSVYLISPPPKLSHMTHSSHPTPLTSPPLFSPHLLPPLSSPLLSSPLLSPPPLSPHLLPSHLTSPPLLSPPPSPLNCTCLEVGFPLKKAWLRELWEGLNLGCRKTQPLAMASRGAGPS